MPACRCCQQDDRAARTGAVKPLTLERPVRVFVVDIDGCLAAVGHAAMDLPRLERIAALNRASRDDPSVPPVSYVTGRPHAYVDAFTQVLGVDLPVSFENGAGLATRHPYRAWLAPGIEAALEHLHRLERLVGERDDMFVQLGKVASATIFPREETFDVGPLMDALRGMLQEHDLDLVLDDSNDCVNVLLPGIDKASGFAWLCEELGIEPRDVAGIGDSGGDIGWLRACGVSFAPSNASAAVRAAVTHAVEAPDASATALAYEALVLANRELSPDAVGRRPG
jgi:hydroxymethylpyrimidine pyrophosphatase-like HAD family hydrolase